MSDTSTTNTGTTGGDTKAGGDLHDTAKESQSNGTNQQDNGTDSQEGNTTKASHQEGQGESNNTSQGLSDLGDQGSSTDEEASGSMGVENDSAPSTPLHPLKDHPYLKMKVLKNLHDMTGEKAEQSSSGVIRHPKGARINEDLKIDWPAGNELEAWTQEVPKGSYLVEHHTGEWEIFSGADFQVRFAYR